MLRSDRRERLEARTVRMQSALRRDRHRRKILKPALRLQKSLYFGRQRARVEVVHDKDHYRVTAFELVQLGQQGEPFFLIELVEDVVDQWLGLSVFVMPPIGARWRPICPANQLDDRVYRIEQAA